MKIRCIALDLDRTTLNSEGHLSEETRIAIARAIASNVDLIFADEPTGNLDTATEEEIIRIFRMLTEETEYKEADAI